jgi:hypothetical protein
MDAGDIGRRIYYTGDMANPDGEGVIIAYRPADRWHSGSFDVRLDDGRDWRGIHPASFDPSPGRRFWLLDEWEAARQLRIEAMKAAMAARTPERAS